MEACNSSSCRNDSSFKYSDDQVRRKLKQVVTSLNSRHLEILILKTRSLIVGLGPWSTGDVTDNHTIIWVSIYNLIREPPPFSNIVIVHNLPNFVRIRPKAAEELGDKVTNKIAFMVGLSKHFLHWLVRWISSSCYSKHWNQCKQLCIFLHIDSDAFCHNDISRWSWWTGTLL